MRTQAGVASPLTLLGAGGAGLGFRDSVQSRGVYRTLVFRFTQRAVYKKMDPDLSWPKRHRLRGWGTDCFQQRGNEKKKFCLTLVCLLLN